MSTNENLADQKKFSFRSSGKSFENWLLTLLAGQNQTVLRFVIIHFECEIDTYVSSFNVLW